MITGGALTEARMLLGLRLGAGIARRLEVAPRKFGRVHSVFERAINVLGHDDRLLTLHGPGPLAAPFAMALHSFPPTGEIEPGTAVERIDGHLTLGALRVAWRGAEVTGLSIPAGRARGPLVAALLETPLPSGAAALGSPLAVAAQRRVAEGIERGDGQLLLDGAVGLIGLGEGLTPAGDDCLVGVLAVLWRFHPDFLLRQRAISDAIISSARVGTTVVAREFLFSAVDGTFSEAVVGLVSAPTTGAAQSALPGLLQMGATSGADTAAGIRLALTALGAR